MPKLTEIGGDPFEEPVKRAAVSGKIGGRNNVTTGQQFHQSAPLAATPSAESIEENKPEQSSGKRKPRTEDTDPLEQQTIYLPHTKRKFLRVHAANADKDISGIVNEALDLYRAKYNV